MKRGRKWGSAARPATPGCFPRGRQEVPAGPSRAMAPWRKTDKERHGVGKTGPRDLGRRRAGGQRAAQEGAGEPAVWTQAASAHSSSEGSLCCCVASRIGKGRQGERKVGTSPSSPLPLLAAHRHRAALFLQVSMHFLDGFQQSSEPPASVSGS